MVYRFAGATCQNAIQGQIAFCNFMIIQHILRYGKVKAYIIRIGTDN